MRRPWRRTGKYSISAHSQALIDAQLSPPIDVFVELARYSYSCKTDACSLLRRKCLSLDDDRPAG